MACSGASLAVLAGNRFTTLGLILTFIVADGQVQDESCQNGGFSYVYYFVQVLN